MFIRTEIYTILEYLAAGKMWQKQSLLFIQ